MALFVYVTTASPEEAHRIGRSAVERRLAACANVLGPMRSVYWWDGAVQEGDETVLILKTRADCAEALTAHIRALHSYEVPCIVTLPITGGNEDFLTWLRAEAHNT